MFLNGLSGDYLDRREVPDEKIKDVHDDLDGRKGKYWDRGWRREHFGW